MKNVLLLRTQVPKCYVTGGHKKKKIIMSGHNFIFAMTLYTE